MKTFKNKMTGVGLMLGVFMVSEVAHAVSFCPSNQWTIGIDQAGVSSKADLLSVIDLVGNTLGFSVTGVQSIPNNTGVEYRYIFVELNPGAFISPPPFGGVPSTSVSADPEKVAKEFVKSLNGIPGTTANCNIPPSVSGSN